MAAPHSKLAHEGMGGGEPRLADAVLVVDDDVYTQQLLKSLLRRKVGHLEVAGTLAEARKAFRTTDFNLVILDQRLPDGSGLDFFGEMRAERPRQIAVLITAYAAVHDAVRAVREGFFDYLTKPFENLDELESVIAKAVEVDRAYREIAELRSRVGAHDWQPIIGNSPKMTQLLATVRSAAPLDTTVLIEGESGTGKELCAKLVHEASARAGKPMVTVNCGALSESLLEASLFGYEKGAFTGAVKTTPGYFERSDGGTLFLDEIADMSPKLQASLLRVLQEHTFDRLGSSEHRRTDFRLVCATNKSLLDEVKAGRFRSDLYYRINVVAIRIPPLREHPQDVAPLAFYFLAHFAKKFGKPECTLAPAALQAMERWHWPGNVRELKHAVERGVALAQGGVLHEADLGLESLAPSPGIGGSDAAAGVFAEARDTFERDYFTRLLKQAGGSVSEAARISGIARQNLYGHLHRLQIPLRAGEGDQAGAD